MSLQINTSVENSNIYYKVEPDIRQIWDLHPKLYIMQMWDQGTIKSLISNKNIKKQTKYNKK